VGGGGVLTALERDCMELINETYPLFLECGRQLSLQFRDEAGI
jgi:hypothetical protein